MFGEKIIPLGGINVDLHESLLPPNVARFIKNLAYEISDTATATGSKGGQTGVFKPLESNEIYIDDLVLPDGDNSPIGTYTFPDTRQAFVFVHNSNNQHTIYRINGRNQTFNIVYQGPTLNFQLQPQYFVHKGGCWLYLVYLTNPDNGDIITRSFLMFTDGYNPQRFIDVEDSIATNSFDATLFPYFSGSYDPMILINMGVPTPSDCISVSEKPVTPSSIEKNNALLFNTWQFRLRNYDVWGRPSEYGPISEMYIPAGNDCISSSSGLARCLQLLFDAPTPQIDKVEVAFRRCNDQQWYTSDVLDLYVGNPIGPWWLRKRNPDVSFDSSTNKISYEFCADKECQPIAPVNTNRLYNPLPRTSQSVARVGEFMSVGNNMDGFLPFSKDLKDHIQVVVDAPASTGNTSNNFRNAVIMVEIFNPFTGFNEPIYEQPISIGSPNKAFGFGSFENPVFRINVFQNYLQYFKNASQKGFAGYLGENIFTISKQFVLDTRTGVYTEVLVYPIPSDPDSIQFFRYFQQFEFNNVPKGIYIFRVASHQSDPSSDANWQQTSTYSSGTFGFNFSNTQAPVNHDLLISAAPELVVDICTSNYDSKNDNKILTIWDLSAPGVAVNQGYVYNTSDTTQNKFGVELLRVNGGMLPFQPRTTDYNGFYFAASTTNRFTTQITGYCGCQLIELAGTRAGSTRKVWIQDFFLDTSDGACPNSADRACNIILVKGKVVLCNSTIGVPNVAVVLSRGKRAVTDSNGEFTIIAYDDTVNPTRIDKVYYVSNTCNFTDCNGECVQPVQVVIQKCITCAARSVTVSSQSILFRSARGLLSGATYPVGVVGWDWLGRPTFVQPLENISIPSTQQTKIFSPSTVRINILAGAVFPPETKYITFWIGPPADIQEYITWIVDKVEFIDNTGKVNNTAPTQIKIYYGSLVEYNKQNNFNTTVNWNFIPEGSTTPVISDKVEFLLNGDGTFFEKSIVQLVKYDTEGQFFLIDFTEDLRNLKANAFIRIVRPKQCTTSDLYFEVCHVVDVVDGHAMESSFILNAFDTYYLNRQIPVPTTVGTETVNELRIFGVPFESDSPSDFWGKGCHNIGRVNILNPYETVLFHQDQIALSGALSSTGQLNFLNFFDDAKKISFSETPVNGIVSILPETSTVLVLGQSDNFIVGFNDNLVRVNQDGTAQAGSIENTFGQPQRKVGANFGCQLFDKNTIYKYQGMVQFLDTVRAAVIQHNYQVGVAISQNGAESYIRPKIKEVQDYNLTHNNTRYFHGVINPINDEYILTDYIIGSKNYINNLRQFDVTAQETIAFDILSKAFKVSYSFTPPFYEQLEGEVNDQQLFSFPGGIPYRHYTTLDNKSYNTFYGQVVERVIQIVIVMDNLKKKKPLSIGEYCKQGVYFADLVETETGQTSRMLINQFIEAEYGWFAPFLCDLNTPFDPNIPAQTGANKLMDGNVLVGTWIKIRLVGDPAINNQYSEFQGVVTNVFASEKSGAK